MWRSMANTNNRKKKPAGGSERGKAAPKRKKNGQKNGASQGSSFFRALTGIFLLVLIVVAAGLTFRHFFPPETQKGKRHYEVFPQHDSVSGKKHDRPDLTYTDESADKPEVHKDQEEGAGVEDVTGGTDEPEKEKPPVRRENLPQVALIIDDIGYDRSMAKKLADIDPGMTLSVLPHSPNRREIMAYARKTGVEIMLHLPMEPMEYPKVDPGPGALLMAQDADTMIGRLHDALESVPDAVGVNNHMGSRMTSESTRMYQVFSILRKKGLFFIDSRTSPKSVCRPSAALLQLTFGERDVFLDHSQDRETIRKQLRTLVRTAERKGTAIGIGHPHTETYEILVEEYSRLTSRVNIVHASELVRPAG